VTAPSAVQVCATGLVIETTSEPGAGAAGETELAGTAVAVAGVAGAVLVLVASAAVVAVADGCAATTTPRQAVRESRAASGIAADATVVTEERIEVHRPSKEVMDISIN
jgi:hypothetical protein